MPSVLSHKPIHHRLVWNRRNNLIVTPKQFRRPHPVKPTPGGRWKVRKTIGGSWIAYTEWGTKNAYLCLSFDTMPKALEYAIHQTYISKLHKNRVITQYLNKEVYKLYKS